MPNNNIKVLFIGDIIGNSGRQVIKKLLPRIITQYKIDICIANAENAAGGNPAYPAAIADLEAYMTSGYTNTCSDGATALAYNVAGNGEVTCANHPR